VAVDTTADVDVAYSCIEGPLAPGEGNLNVDPLFVAAGEYDFARTSAVEIAGSVAELPAFEVVPGDFRLREDSPAHDAALTELAAERDIAGRDRPCGDEADQGAHERCPEVGGISFLRGDADANGARELNDALRVLGHLFIGTAPLSCAAAADTDDSGVLDVTDATFLLDHLFLGGLQPPEPFATCGADPTTDDLGCAAYPPCL
jgi:hypothetical protein